MKRDTGKDSKPVYKECMGRYAFTQLLKADIISKPMFISKVLKSVCNRSEEAHQMFAVAVLIQNYEINGNKLNFNLALMHDDNSYDFELSQLITKQQLIFTFF